MRFLQLVALAAFLSVGPAISEDLLFSDGSPDLSFSDSPADTSTFQDMPQDLLASQNLLEGSTLTADDDDDNIFKDSEKMDPSSSSIEASELYSDSTVPCSIENGQSLNKLRPRDGPTVCSPQGSTPLELRPLRDAWNAIQKWQNRILSPNPEPKEPPPPPAPKPWHPEDSRCDPYFPFHLCCADQILLNLGALALRAPYNSPIYNYAFCANGLLQFGPLSLYTKGDL